MAVQITRWQFTADDYERMVETGILGKNDRVELIDGEVIAMSPIGPPHAGIVNRLNAVLSSRLADTAIVSVQNPIRLNDYSEPQPDLAILQPNHDYYAHAHPTPADILLLVEVADSSFEYDSEEKMPRYAQNAIPEVWLIDVEHQMVTQYAHPLITGYRHQVKLVRGQILTSQTITGLEIAINAIFG
jgi:Uma2 family endonuclease